MGLEGEPDYRRILHLLLQHALIDIRSATAEESPSKKIYALSTLVHNLPMMLLAEDSGKEPEYERMYFELLDRAKALGVSAWVRSVSR